MKEDYGKPAVPGIVIGKIFLYRKATKELPIPCGDIATEQYKFEQAIETARSQLKELVLKTRAELGEEQAMIIHVQLMIMDDLDYLESVQAIIKCGASAAKATLETGNTFASAFASMDDEYI